MAERRHPWGHPGITLHGIECPAHETTIDRAVAENPDATAVNCTWDWSSPVVVATRWDSDACAHVELARYVDGVRA